MVRYAGDKDSTKKKSLAKGKRVSKVKPEPEEETYSDAPDDVELGIQEEEVELPFPLGTKVVLAGRSKKIAPVVGEVEVRSYRGHRPDRHHRELAG